MVSEGMASIHDLCNSDDEECREYRPTHRESHPAHWISSAASSQSYSDSSHPQGLSQQQYARHQHQPTGYCHNHRHEHSGHHRHAMFGNVSPAHPSFPREHPSSSSPSSFSLSPFSSSNYSHSPPTLQRDYHPHPHPRPYTSTSSFTPAKTAYAHTPHHHQHRHQHHFESSSWSPALSPRVTNSALAAGQDHLRFGNQRSLSNLCSPLRSTHDPHHQYSHSHPHPHPYQSPRPRAPPKSHDSHTGLSREPTLRRPSLVHRYRDESSVSEHDLDLHVCGLREESDAKKSDPIKEEDIDEPIAGPSLTNLARAAEKQKPSISPCTSTAIHGPRSRAKVSPEERTPRRSATIKIVQQPLHARMCGFGEKDRRPVDPPPVVQLVLQDGPDPEYNLFKLPQKKKLSAAAKRKKALALGAAATVVVAKKKIREGASKRKTGMDSDSDHRDVAEGDDDLNEPDRASESECAGSDSEDEDEDEKKHHTGPRSQRDHKGHISPISIEEVPRWEDFYENLDTGAIPLAQDPLFVLSCSLWSHDGTEVRNMVSTSSGGVSGHGNSSGAASHKRDKLTTSCQTVNPSARPPKLTRILMGSVVVSPILLFNDKGEQGWYFSFPDLSIRTEGVYTLKFSLIRLGSFNFMSPPGDDEDQSPVIAVETSEPFTVFSAKKFPGMTESTPLSKAFARQGLKIPIRNDLRVRKTDKD